MMGMAFEVAGPPMVGKEGMMTESLSILRVFRAKGHGQWKQYRRNGMGLKGNKWGGQEKAGERWETE